MTNFLLHFEAGQGPSVFYSTLQKLFVRFPVTQPVQQMKKT